MLSGEAELAIWQISAIKPIKGLEIVGPLPADLQFTTHLSAALTAAATAPDSAKALIGFFASPIEAFATMSERFPGAGP